jgi:hypothetical protein
MAVERRWHYERVAEAGAGDGRTCIFCGQVIARESQPGYWVLKAVEDNPDADFIIEDGYAHYACTQDRLAQQRKSRFELPEVPDIPRRG